MSNTGPENEVENTEQGASTNANPETLVETPNYGTDIPYSDDVGLYDVARRMGADFIGLAGRSMYSGTSNPVSDSEEFVIGTETYQNRLERFNNHVDELASTYTDRVDNLINNNEVMREFNSGLDDVRDFAQGVVDDVGEAISDTRLAKYARRLVSNAGESVAGRVTSRLVSGIYRKAPLLSLGCGIYCVEQRIEDGDYEMAVLEGASAVAGTIPGIGSLVSLGIDAEILVYDETGIRMSEYTPTVLGTSKSDMRREWNNMAEFWETGSCDEWRYIKETWKNMDNLGDFMDLFRYDDVRNAEEMAETYIAHEEARIAEESDEAEATNVEIERAHAMIAEARMNLRLNERQRGGGRQESVETSRRQMDEAPREEKDSVNLYNGSIAIAERMVQSRDF